MTKIVAGLFKGRRLAAPAGAITRPTSEKVRAALANALVAGGGIDGAHVLDLYAGSGALGLELLSRGADSLTAVENHRGALNTLRANVSALGVDNVTIVAADVAGAADRLPHQHFDIMVADPPYALASSELSVVLAAMVPTMATGADVVVERSVRSSEVLWPAGLHPVRAKRYGDTVLYYATARGD